MSISRRSFLKTLGTVAGGALVAYAGRDILFEERLAKRRPTRVTGKQTQFETTTLPALLAASEKLLGKDIELDRYEAFFRWHYDHRPEYTGIYKEFVAGNKSARKRVADQILGVFARTDAWVALGYESWPGQPRGLTAYRQAPAGISS